MTRVRRVIDLMFFDGFRAAPALMWMTLILTILNGAAQATFPLGFKVFIDGVVSGNTAQLVVGVALSGALITVFWIAAMADANVGFALVDRMDLYVTTRIAERVNGVATIEHFERPEYLQQLDLLDQNRHLLRTSPRQTLTAISAVVRAMTMVALLMSVHPALALLPVFSVAPALAQAWSVRVRQKADETLAEHKRLADGLFTLASTEGPAKELRVFDLCDEVIARFVSLGDSIVRSTSLAAMKGAFVSAAGLIVFVAGIIAGLVLVVRSAVEGRASSGEVVLAVVVSQQARRLLTEAANDFGTMLTTARTATRALWLEDYASEQAADGGRVSPPERLLDGIRLDSVTFRYPGGQVDAVHDVNLVLPAGASVAVVGENGAGKTTLIKLLTGMYSPTSGAISVDGLALDEIAVSDWRLRLSASFQDYVQFELVAREVVGIGDLPRMTNLPSVERALHRANATDVATGLAHGFDTQLGRSFPQGQELSGGQWQKLALGRGMMRDDPLLLVLDEPTASLDAETEHALFEGFANATHRTGRRAGAITVLVSHRFSTVRSADLIVVMSEGRVAEVGSHAQLMTRSGLYSELFTLQARGYR